MATGWSRGDTRFTWAASQRSAARARALRLAALLAALAVLTGANAAPAAGDPPLVGAWRFDEAGGQWALDSGPHGLDGRFGDTTAADAADPVRIPGVSGGALHFQGSSYVRLPEAGELAPRTLTIEAVVRAPSSPGAWRYLVSRGSYECESGAYGLYTAAAGGLAIYVFNGSRYVVSAVARPADVWDGAWHHVAGTFDGRVLRIYVDGRPVGGTLDTPLTIDYAGTTKNAAFGRYVGSCSLPFVGDLDFVRLWSGAGSASWVATEAARALRPGTDPSPVGQQPPLPAALAPEALPAARPSTGPSGGGAPAGAPGAPPRACTVALSRRRIAAGQRSTVRARVTLRGRPARRVRVVAARRGKRITATRTNARGRARLKLRVHRPGRVRISAATSPRCAAAYIRVAR